MLLFPLVLSYFPKLKPSNRAAEISMLAGGLTALVAYLIGSIQGDTITPKYLFGIEPMYVGMIFSALPILISRRAQSQP
jgi:hypothetical protein